MPDSGARLGKNYQRVPASVDAGGMQDEIERERLVEYGRAEGCASGTEGSLGVEAKLYASEMVNRVGIGGADSRQRGYARDRCRSDVPRERVVSIYEGTSEIRG